MMLTGDAASVARWVAKELELDDYFAKVLPDKKAQKVKEVRLRGLITARTWDSVNDAPALTQADISIAIGAGTDLAIPQAAGVLHNFGILLSPAVGTVLMAASTVGVAINAGPLCVSRAGVS
jgi:P-type Cu2+ transporter